MPTIININFLLEACNSPPINGQCIYSSLTPSLSVTHCSPSDHFPLFTELYCLLKRSIHSAVFTQ